VTQPTGADADGAGTKARRVRVVDLDWRSVLTLFAAFAVMIALTALARAVPRALTWIVIATVLSLALNPVVSALQRRLHCPRGIAVVVLLVFIVTAIALTAYLLGPETVKQARGLEDDIPDIVQELTELPVVGGLLEDSNAPDEIENWLQDLPDHLAGETAQIEDAARSILSGALAGFAILLLIISLLLDGAHLTSSVRRAIPKRHRERVDHMGELLYRIVGRYFGGSVLVAVTHGFSVLVVGIVLGVPLTPLLAVWVTVWSLVPQIGGAVGGIPFVVFALTQGAIVGVIAGVFFVLYLLFENHVLTPLVVGDAVDLSPPTTMVAAIVGVSIAGVPGALIGVPFLGAAKALYIELRMPERAEADRQKRLAKRVPTWMFWKKRHAFT
jgi:predicted PurR-regulated permease PerM